MNGEFFDSIKISAYFLWEYTESQNALGLWCCAEDIANFFAMNKIISFSQAENIINLNKNDSMYIEFVRNISYRIFLYTNNRDFKRNWYIAERLIYNGEWLYNIVKAASILCKKKSDDSDFFKLIRSDAVKEYYKIKKI